MRRCGTWAKHAGVPLRCVRAVEGAGRLFSTPSRPALRAASGRPQGRQPHDGHRGADLTLTRGDPARRRASASRATALGTCQTHGNRRSSPDPEGAMSELDDFLTPTLARQLEAEKALVNG